MGYTKLIVVSSLLALVGCGKNPADKAIGLWQRSDMADAKCSFIEVEKIDDKFKITQTYQMPNPFGSRPISDGRLYIGSINGHIFNDGGQVGNIEINIGDNELKFHGTTYKRIQSKPAECLEKK